MSATMEKKEKNTVVLKVTVETDKLEGAVGRKARELAKQLNIPGFRKGKAPRHIVQRTVGTEALYHEAAEDVIGPAYTEAVKATGIEPVDYPKVDIVTLEPGQALVFNATVTVKPEVELGEYKGLGVEKEAAAVSDEQIEEELKRKQEQHARLVTLEEGTVENGDTANIDFEGFVDNVPFAGGRGDGYDLVLGSGTFIPGFEEQLVGAEIGQSVDVNVKFPDEYHSEDLAGKEALFKVKVNKIKRKELSPLDDEFAKDVSEFETLDELKSDIRNKLMEKETSRVDNAYRNGIIAKAAENASVEIPEAMIDRRIDTMVEDLKQNLAYQGLNMEQYFSITNSNEADMRERFRPQAAESVKTGLVLEEIAKKEGIQVTEDELNNELQKLAEQYHQEADVLKKSLEARGDLEWFKERMITDKAVEFLVENNA